jgi:hypothetical protein
MSAPAEFYVVASENMRPVEAVGPFQTRETAVRVVTILKCTKVRFPLSIATRRPVCIPVMPAERFIALLEAAMWRSLAQEAPQ